MKAVEKDVMVESRLMSGCLRGVAKVDGLVGGLLGVAKMSICWFFGGPFRGRRALSRCTALSRRGGWSILVLLDLDDVVGWAYPVGIVAGALCAVLTARYVRKSVRIRSMAIKMTGCANRVLRRTQQRAIGEGWRLLSH